MQATIASLDLGSASSTSAAATSVQNSPATTLDSIDLLQGQKSISIQHNGSIYRLQATKLGKLILTK